MNPIALHPILGHFLTLFKERDHPPSGILVGNMEECVIEDTDLQGAYFVCAATVKITRADFIHCTGPGGGLIAGNRVELKAPDITLVGNESDPIQVVALKDLSIEATDLKIQNVIFYLFNDASFSMNASIFSRVENIRVVRLTLDNQILVQEEVAYWKDGNALATFINHHKASLQQEDRPLEAMEPLLERWLWEKEAARKMGLRPALV